MLSPQRQIFKITQSKIFKILFFLLVLIRLTSAYSQTDSVLLWREYKTLNSTIEIVFSENGKTILEKYSYFKYHYWDKGIDTLPLDYYNNIIANKSIKIYRKVNKCDTLINKIRNESKYRHEYFLISEYGRAKIGLDYGQKQYSDYDGFCYFFSDEQFITKTCHDKYLEWQRENIKQAYLCIDSIFQQKKQRLQNISSNLSLLTPSFIDSFIFKYSDSELDAKVLSLIIINKTDLFINSINKLEDFRFFNFKLKLNSFPKEIDINILKSALKSSAINVHRKKEVIRSIKNITYKPLLP